MVVAAFNQEKALVGAFLVILRIFMWTFVSSSTEQHDEEDKQHQGEHQLGHRLLHGGVGGLVDPLGLEHLLTVMR